MKIIMKFGGTSVGCIAALNKVVEIVKKAVERGHQVVIVASAMSTVTNQLIEAAHQAEAGDDTVVHPIRLEIEDKHDHIIQAFLTDLAARETLRHEIKTFLDEFELLCHGIRVLGELTPRALDVISGLGERLSVRQIAAILNTNDLSAIAVDATELIVTDARHGAASPLTIETAQKIQAALKPLLHQKRIPVITGFISATATGVPTTLGRGGSDYSATIIGRALEADEVWIWTDVNGIMTADPKVVPNAQTIAQLSYTEVAELAYFGAKVLHPQTIRPARQTGIPIRILNTFEPDHPGTLINKTVQANKYWIKAITMIKHLSLITVAGTGMIGVPGVAARVFAAVARVGSNVLMISQSSSEQSICFVVKSIEAAPVLGALHEDMVHELERGDLDKISTQDDVVILAIVGAGTPGTPEISARLFGALGRAGINILAIAQGSSEYNISLVVIKGNCDRAVQIIHEEFRLTQRWDSSPIERVHNGAIPHGSW